MDYGVLAGLPLMVVIFAMMDRRQSEKNAKRTAKARRTRNKANPKSKTGKRTSKGKTTSKSKLITFAQWKRINKIPPKSRSKKQKRDYFLYNMAKGRRKNK